MLIKTFTLVVCLACAAPGTARFGKRFGKWRRNMTHGRGATIMQPESATDMPAICHAQEHTGVLAIPWKEVRYLKCATASPQVMLAMVR